MDHLGEAEELFQQAADRSGGARVKVVMADLLVMLEDLPSAEKAYQDALATFLNSPDGSFQARARIGLANLRLRAGEVRAAKALLETATFDCQRSEDWTCRGNVGIRKAQLYFQEGDEQRAIASLQGARAIFEHMDRPYDLAVSYMIEGEGLAAHDADGAETAFRRAAELYREAHRPDLAGLAEERIEALSRMSE